MQQTLLIISTLLIVSFVGGSITVEDIFIIRFFLLFSRTCKKNKVYRIGISYFCTSVIEHRCLIRCKIGGD